MKQLTCLLLGLPLIGCHVGALAKGAPQAPVSCSALVGYSYSRALPRNTLITSAALNAATATVPEHCHVQGSIDGNRQGYGPTPGDARSR